MWSEIITKRNYFNINELIKIKDTAITKEDVLKFFDRIFTSKLQKLSVQEYSKKVNIPDQYNKVRDFEAVKVTGLDFFRKRGKFLPRFKPTEKEKILRTVKVIK